VDRHRPCALPVEELGHLPESVRAEIRRERLAQEARAVELVRRQRRLAVRDTVAMALLFGASDLVLPGTRPWSPFAAGASGAIVGWICQALDGARLFTGIAGLVAFFVFECWSRDGISPLHFFYFFGFGVACAYLGYRREEREME
jgi:hypothetical protein